MVVPYDRKEQIGPCTLYQGDAYALMPHLGFFGAVVTDPPYLIDVKGGGAFGNKNRKYQRDIMGAKLTQGFDPAFLEPGFCGSFVVFCHNDQLHTLLPLAQERFHRHAVLSWHKSNPMPVANKHYRPDTEFFVHAWGKEYHPVGRLEDKGRQWVGAVGKSTYDHPTVKPLPLMMEILKNVNPGEAPIIDPFMGTGTTLVASVLEGKPCVGVEIEPRYFDIACERVALAVELAGKGEVVAA
jgi:DNA modification methylase